MKRIIALIALLSILFPITAEGIDYYAIAKTISTDEVKQLIDDGFDIDTDLDGYNALTLAALNDRTDIVQLLLSEGADVNARNSRSEMSALSTLVMVNWYLLFSPVPYDIAELLVQAGADVNERNPRSGDTMLIYLANYDDPQMIEILIDNGANVNSRNERGSTALMEVARTLGLEENARMLIEAGADINATDSEGRSALIYAAIGRNPELLSLFINNGADSHKRDIYGLTALDYARENSNIYRKDGYWELLDASF